MHPRHASGRARCPRRTTAPAQVHLPLQLQLEPGRSPRLKSELSFRRLEFRPARDADLRPSGRQVFREHAVAPETDRESRAFSYWASIARDRQLSNVEM